ncbi:transglycosylase SLT domain-containing protein [Streptomyces sp. RB6PN25]|uniref:Transglycosylase SLT domain-containing protein n=1 Tax=Streptomyces humicola TaxID=2953240 RepID=A0ABT1Q2N5_9ACTN|nr:transglycosylase SLT domain-containing protein [Streptomyces humicola]MCQ4084194.1 transglycosylase SLT domain-containing protein [Streptomyces humicola]
MPIPAVNRLTRTHVITASGAIAAGAVALACTVVPGSAQASNAPARTPVAHTVTKPTPSTAAPAKPAPAQPAAAKAAPVKAAPAKPQAPAARPARHDHPRGAAATRPTDINVAPVAYSAPAVSYPDDLDGWIRHALAIMQQNGIPGTYDGIYRNIMRESSGNPYAENDWDSNAAAGTPSKGLLQVIQPTFDEYHVSGTAWDLFDPVANITAACNYAYHVYGSIDNVYSAY